MKNINVDFCVEVKEYLSRKDIFQKIWKFFIREDFLETSEEKAHNLSNHIENFKEKIKINQQWENRRDFEKYDIYYINYGINIWNEINGTRPSLVFKSDRHNKWADIIVIPMTWAKDIQDRYKLQDKFDISIVPDTSNKLWKESYLKLRLMKSVSKKRFWRKIGKLENTFDNEYMYDLIDRKIKSMLGIKENPSEWIRGFASTRVNEDQ